MGFGWTSSTEVPGVEVKEFSVAAAVRQVADTLAAEALKPSVGGDVALDRPGLDPAHAGIDEALLLIPAPPGDGRDRTRKPRGAESESLPDRGRDKLEPEQHRRLAIDRSDPRPFRRQGLEHRAEHGAAVHPLRHLAHDLAPVFWPEVRADVGGIPQRGGTDQNPSTLNGSLSAVCVAHRGGCLLWPCFARPLWRMPQAITIASITSVEEPRRFLISSFASM